MSDNLRDMIVSIAFKDNASKAVQEVNKSMDAVKKAFQSSATGAAKTSQAVKDVGGASKAAAQSIKRTDSGFKATAATMKTVQTAFKRTESNASKMSGTFHQATAIMKNAASAAKPIPPELTKMQRAMKSVGDASKTAASKMQSFASSGLGKLKSASMPALSSLKSGFRSLPGLVGGATMKVGSSITNFITAPLRGAVGMIKQYAGALGLLSGGALAASGMGRLSAIENARTSLTVMMGDAGKANKFMDDILAFAKTTPFAFPDLAETSRNLIAFGMDEAKVVPTMKAIGDAAAATGKGSEGLNQVAAAFGDMQIAGTLGLDQINRLQAAGVPALKIMANTFGISTDKMKKKISDGSVDSVKAIDQLVKGMQEGTKGVAGNTAAMAGIMEKTKENWTGSVDSLKSSISSTMATLIEPVKPHLQEGMAWFGQTFSKLPDLVFGAVAAVKPVFEQLKPIFESAKQSFDSFIEPLKETFAGTGAVIQDFISDVVAQYLPLIENNFKTTFEGLTPVIDTVASVIKDVGEVVGFLVQNVVLPLVPIMQSTISSAFTAIQPVLEVIKTAFTAVKNIIMILVNNVVIPLIPIVSSIISTAFSIISPILRIASSLFGVIIDVIMFLVNNVVKPLLPIITDVISDLWKDIQPILEGIAKLFDGIADAIEWAVGKFKSFTDAAANFKMPKIGMPKWMGGNGLIQPAGSHATGLGRVPYDEYPMFAHKDEAILTAQQANALRTAGMLKGDGVGPSLDLSKPAVTGSSSGGGKTENHYNFSVNVNGGGNAQEVAHLVRKEIDAIFARLNAGTV